MRLCMVLLIATVSASGQLNYINLTIGGYRMRAQRRYNKLSYNSPRCLSVPDHCDKPRNVSNFGARHHWRGSSADRGRVKPGRHCALFSRVWGNNICQHKCDYSKGGALAPAGDWGRGKLGWDPSGRHDVLGRWTQFAVRRPFDRRVWYCCSVRL